MWRLTIWLCCLLLYSGTIPVPLMWDIAPDLQTARLELRRFLFASDELPDILPDANMNVHQANGETNAIRVHEVEYPRGIIIYHIGHLAEMQTDTEAIALFVQAGYTVYVIDMPASPHARFADMPAIGSPIRYFVEPTIALINWLEVRGIHNIIMAGLSGGGWTITLAAAIDERITASYPVAGSIPLSMRENAANMGDWEQTYAPLYRVASYETLYALGASNGRRQLQIRNVRDDCCFGGTNMSYVNTVKSRAPSFDIWLDYAANGHVVSSWAVRIILGDLVLEELNG